VLWPVGARLSIEAGKQSGGPLFYCLSAPITMRHSGVSNACTHIFIVAIYFLTVGSLELEKISRRANRYIDMRMATLKVYNER
jgi:hypothetical protein